MKEDPAALRKTNTPSSLRVRQIIFLICLSFIYELHIHVDHILQVCHDLLKAGTQHCRLLLQKRVCV
jgi:hypothetical protein